MSDRPWGPSVCRQCPKTPMRQQNKRPFVWWTKEYNGKQSSLVCRHVWCVWSWLGELLDSCPVLANSSSPLLHSFVGMHDPPWASKCRHQWWKVQHNCTLFCNVSFSRSREIPVTEQPKIIVCTVSIQCCISLGSQMAHYPTGQNHPMELMLAKFMTAKIAKNLHPMKLKTNRCL